MNNIIEEYRNYWKNLVNVQNVISVLHWDSEVVMPEQGRLERAEQISGLSALHHKLYTSEEFLKIIDNLENYVSKSNDLEDSKILKREIEVLKRDRNRATKLPTSLVEKFARTTNIAHGVWVSARKNKNFKEFEPILGEIIDLNIEMAEAYTYSRNRYDALLESYEYGLTVENLDPLFKKLKNSLIPLINEAKEFSNPFKKEISEDKQELFNKKLPPALGLPTHSSRLDKSAHPFSTSLGRADLRITTRYNPNDPTTSIMAVLHETGHSLYEMGLGMMPNYPNPLSIALSYGVHESQSRLWENQIGRSRAFWDYYYPTLIKDFEISPYDLSIEDLYNYINSTSKTKVRVDADQITYNLHIILRYEIEKELISDGLKVSEIPERWNTAMKELLDLDIENDSEGALQDVHWSGGSFGYFPTYTLGNIYSAQLFHTFLSSNSNFWNEVRDSGDFSSLLIWLQENVHKKGRLYDADDLLEKVTGQKPNSDFLVKYLKAKVKEFF